MVTFYNLHKLNRRKWDTQGGAQGSHAFFFAQNWAAVRPSGWIDEYDKALQSKLQVRFSKLPLLLHGTVRIRRCWLVILV